MKKETKVILGLLLFFITFYFILNFIPSRNLENNYRFTLAEIIDFETQSEGSIEAKIVYNIKGVSYNGSFPLVWGYEKKFKIGQKVFVKYYTLNPKNAQINYDLNVNDSLAKKGGDWKEIPID
jgi:hypothetical protein